MRKQGETEGAVGVEYESRMVRVEEITVPLGRRASREEKVIELMESISEVGLLQSPTIMPGGELVLGLHRLEAVKRLGWPVVPCRVVPGKTEEDRLRAKMMELDENLVRAELTALERADCIAGRKVLYLKLHPETAAGVAGGKASGEARRDEDGTTRKMRLVPEGAGEAAPSFVADTAAKTGQSKATISRAAQIGEKLTPGARLMVRGTPVADNQSELLKLSRMNEARQNAVASKLNLGFAKTVAQAEKLVQDEEVAVRMKAAETAGMAKAASSERSPQSGDHPPLLRDTARSGEGGTAKAKATAGAAKDGGAPSRGRVVDVVLPEMPEIETIRILRGPDIGKELHRLGPLSVDLIFTEPPEGAKDARDYKMLGQAGAAILKDGGSLVTTVGQNWFSQALGHLEMYLLYRWVLGKDRDRIGIARGLGVQWQWCPVLWFGKGKQCPAGGMPDWLDDTGHRIPQGAARMLVEHLTLPGGVVVDPYPADGMRLAAALRAGRKVVGIVQDVVGERALRRVLNAAEKNGGGGKGP